MLADAVFVFQVDLPGCGIGLRGRVAAAEVEHPRRFALPRQAAEPGPRPFAPAGAEHVALAGRGVGQGVDFFHADAGRRVDLADLRAVEGGGQAQFQLGAVELAGGGAAEVAVAVVPQRGIGPQALALFPAQIDIGADDVAREPGRIAWLQARADPEVRDSPRRGPRSLPRRLLVFRHDTDARKNRAELELSLGHGASWQCGDEREADGRKGAQLSKLCNLTIHKCIRYAPIACP